MRTLRKTVARPLVAFACCSILCAAAQADDASLIYARIVGGVDYQNHVVQPDGSTATQWRGAGNQWGTSWLGWKGSEDLGAGLKAVYRLEAGYSTATGITNNPALFNRRAFVGLDGRAGTLKLGKNLFLSGDVWFLDPTGQQFIGSATLVRGRNWPGADNVVEYVSPDLDGLQVTLQAGLGEQPGSFRNLRRDGVELAYLRGPLELRAILTRIRDPDGRFTGIFDSSQEAMAGMTWHARRLKLYATWEHLRAPDAAPGMPTRADHYWVGANYDLTPALTLIGAIFRVRQDANAGRATLYMAGANYSLSKSTLLYLSVGQVRNGANAHFSVEATNDDPLPGQHQTGGYAGAVYNF
jgi:predicted porin